MYSILHVLVEQFQQRRHYGVCLLFVAVRGQGPRKCLVLVEWQHRNAIISKKYVEHFLFSCTSARIYRPAFS
jgi:hypothetical protein